MTAAEPDPYQHAFFGMVAARAVTTGIDVGLFDALVDGPATGIELAERLKLDPIGLDALATALRTLGYLDEDDGLYRATAVTERLLVRSSPETAAGFLGPQNDWHWKVLGGLDDTLRSGRPAGWHEAEPGHPLWEDYIRGLYEASRPEHAANAELVPVTDPRTLVDVAGGHGAFAMAMCRKHPGLAATVVDLPGSAAVGREIVGEEGLSDRVAFQEGDVFEVGLGSPRDVISAFNLVHHLSPEANRRLIGMAREALSGEGCLVIGETERPEPGDEAHPMGAMSGLLFYAISGARTYSRAEVTGWLGEAGFPHVEVHRNERSPWRVLYLARP